MNTIYREINDVPITSNTCFILGAGASYDCICGGRPCIPITRDLITRTFLPDELSGLYNQLSKKYPPPKPVLEGPFEVGLEHTFQWLSKLSRSSSRHFRPSALKGLGMLIDLVVDRIRKSQLPAYLNPNQSGMAIAAENYIWLASMCAHFPEMSILNLNYDCILDNALLALKDCNPKPHQLSSWRNIIRDEKYSISNDDGIYVKLHGSLDLFHCINPNCNDFESILLPEWADQHKEYLGGILECPSCKKRAYEMIVPPTKNKKVDGGLYSNVQNIARKVLGRSNTWIIIGYSFPRYDSDMEDLLCSAVEDFPKYTDIKRHVLIVAPDAYNIAERLRPLLGIEVHFSNESFSEFADNCMKYFGYKRTITRGEVSHGIRVMEKETSHRWPLAPKDYKSEDKDNKKSRE